MNSRLSLTAALATGLLATSLTAQAIEPGDTLNYTFRSAPFHAMGANSIESLRGKPVFIEFWGTR